MPRGPTVSDEILKSRHDYFDYLTISPHKKLIASGAVICYRLLPERRDFRLFISRAAADIYSHFVFASALWLTRYNISRLPP